MINRKFYPILKSLCETDKKDEEPVTINTVGTPQDNGLTLNESRVSVRKSNIEDTTRTNPIRFVKRIQNCFNSNSKTFRNLFRVVFAEETLLMIWDKISRKNVETSYNANSNKVLFWKIKEMSTCLINSCYKFGVRKKAIAYKKNKSEQHLVIMLSPWDKIVIHSVWMVFKFIFDGLWHDKQVSITKSCGKVKTYSYLKPSSYNVSSGVRLGKSYNEVLREVHTWYFCGWFIKININKFFDKVNHNRLLNILRETIEDEPFLTLLRQILNKKTFFKNYLHKSDKGMGLLQSNNLGILLTNIYLNKLDQFVLERKKVWWEKDHFNKNDNNVANKKPGNSNAFVNSLKETALDNQKYNFTKVFKQHKIKSAKWMGLSKTTFSKRIFRRVYYSRYVDNFLLGIRGPKFLAIDVRDETSQFIKCNLQLELQLSEIYHSKSNKVKYLGFDIKVLMNAHNYRSIIKSTIAYTKIKNRLKQKKSSVEARENTFLNQVLRKKITEVAGWTKQKTTHRVKPNEITLQLVQKKLLNVLACSALKPVDVSKNIKLIHSYKSVWNIIKKSENQTNRLFQKNISVEKTLHKLVKNDKFADTLENSLKNLYQTATNISSRQFRTKKRNKTSNRTICKALYDYRQGAGPIFYAPKKSILKLMCAWGMISAISNKPIINKMLFRYNDLSIILYYKNKATNVLEYYKPAKNFYWVKTQVDHQMRNSLLFTLAKKHKTSTFTIIQAIGKSTSIFINNGNSRLIEVASFPTSTYIHNKQGSFNTTFNYIPSIQKLREPFIRTSIPKTLYHECQIKNCENLPNNVKMYHLAAFYKKISPNYIIASTQTHTKKIHWTKVVEFALHKKQVSLCTSHHLAIHTGKLFLEDLKTHYKSFKLLNSQGLAIRF